MALQQCCSWLMKQQPFSLAMAGDSHQILMYGAEGSGKTTLLYRLKCNASWKPDHIACAMKKMKALNNDPAYHYEEFALEMGRMESTWRYGIWDIPGDEVNQSFASMFYKFLQIAAVLFVVDASKETVENLEQMQQTKMLFDFLLNEDELRSCAFIVIYNDHNSKGNSSSKGRLSLTTSSFDPSEQKVEWNLYERAFRETLHIEEVQSYPQHAKRFGEFRVNCAQVERNDLGWIQIISKIRSIHKAMNPGEYYMGSGG